MAGGTCSTIEGLPNAARAILDAARRAALATVADDGTPRVVPICFALHGPEIVTTVDWKPKGTAELARIHNIRARPVATLLADHWSEDWAELGWVMVLADGRVEPPGYAMGELRARYPQYADDLVLEECIVLTPRRLTWWTYAI